MNQIIKFEEKSRIRNDELKEDDELKNALSQLIKQGMKQTVIISCMKRDFHIYSWTERTLKRRISIFKLRSSDTQKILQEARNVIENEIQGPGKLLGYRAMYKKLKQVSFRHYF